MELVCAILQGIKIQIKGSLVETYTSRESAQSLCFKHFSEFLYIPLKKLEVMKTQIFSEGRLSDLRQVTESANNMRRDSSAIAQRLIQGIKQKLPQQLRSPLQSREF